MDISNATTQVALAILSDKTVRRSAVNREYLKHTGNQKKDHISLGAQQSNYLSLETLTSIITTGLPGPNTGYFSCL